MQSDLESSARHALTERQSASEQWQRERLSHRHNTRRLEHAVAKQTSLIHAVHSVLNETVCTHTHIHTHATIVITVRPVYSLA